jgi:hypothetical protein
MRAAGIDRFGGDIGPRELDAPPTPGTDEVLVEVRAAGVGNWDDIARNGAWDLGKQPPTALGVEAAGVVAAVGSAVRNVAVGDARHHPYGGLRRPRRPPAGDPPGPPCRGRRAPGGRRGTRSTRRPTRWPTSAEARTAPQSS